MENKSGTNAPAISLPKGGGAIKGIGETFQPNLFTGTGNFSVPIATSPGRNGFGPQLTLQYSSGNGNGPFGVGWQLSIPRITRKTEKGLPEYKGKDVFVMSGAEDLVQVLTASGDPLVIPEGPYSIRRYRPRTEGLFARIEQWTHTTNDDVHWRVTTKENVTSIYGKTFVARIVDPDEAAHVYEWLLQETFDAKGNHMLYDYIQEDPDLLLPGFHERNRRYTQAYLRRILYGNTPDSLAPAQGIGQTRTATDHRDPLQTKPRHYLFELLFDYGDLPQHPRPHFDWKAFANTDAVHSWPIRKDPFSSFRPGFEIRTVRHCCKRVLMLHHFNEGELVGAPLVKSTDFSYHVNKDTALSFLSAVTIRGYRSRYLHTSLWNDHGTDLRAGILSENLRQEFVAEGVTLDSNASVVTLDAADSFEIRDPHGSYLLVRQGTDIKISTYHSDDMPPVSFKYSEFAPREQRYQSVTAEGDDLPPFALNNPNIGLMDVFGDGLPDVVQSVGHGLHYWENKGDASIGRRHPQHTVPSGADFAQSNVSIGDMGGDGLADLIVDEPPMSGFYESTPDGGWTRFKRFETMPSFDLTDPNTRLVDLTGDGLSDVLVTRDAHFLWFQSKGEQGYEPPKEIPRRHNLDDFPDVYFNDPAGRVRLADMSGDGLSDIVLVHDGRIDYWPNLGYGRFGKRLTLKKPPRIGHAYDPRRLFLADLDGSGTADLVYVDFDRVRFWFNQSGNGWSDEQVIEGTPYVSNLTALQFVDILGTGTTALLWSYDYGTTQGSNYKMLDFCGGKKPNLLTEMDNNMGATTRAHYAPSTKYYLEDKKNGQPWISNLPFPVQVLEKTEVIDHIGKTKLVTTYQYHHGYYDGREREFRGFGRVDQLDTEYFDDFAGAGLHEDSSLFDNDGQGFYVPPVETRSWYHTGIYFDADRYIDHQELTQQYQREYYTGDSTAFVLGPHEFEQIDGVVGPGPGPGPYPHEAFRGLRGSLLRTEVYARDGGGKSVHPYTVTENRYRVTTLQPKGANSHAVYLSTQKESLSYHYERNPDDPRVAHNLTLDIDPYGNVTESVAIAYPRRQVQPDLPEQGQLQIVYNRTDYINVDRVASGSRPAYHYVGLPCQTRSYEVTGISWQTGDSQLTEGVFDSVRDKTPALGGIPDVDPTTFEPYEWQRPLVVLAIKRRLIEWTRNYYRFDTSPATIDAIGNLDHRMSLGEIDSLGLPYESYQAAFRSTQLQSIYADRQVGIDLVLEGGYHPPSNYPACEGTAVQDYWWIPSGRQGFDDNKFFMPIKTQDPFGNAATIELDDYGLLPRRADDALPAPQTNSISTKNDYRVLQPYEITDPNGNRSQVAFDVLGLVVGTAVMGKISDAPAKGDNLNNFVADLPQSGIDDHITDPINSNPHTVLQYATTRLIYDLKRYQRTRDSGGTIQPPVVYTLARETHVADEQGTLSKVQHSFVYSDGFGREAQSKVQAEPGPIYDNNGSELQANADPRWVGTGTKVFNNKGKPVQQFEPFFGDTPAFGIEQHGVSPMLFYDPLERVVCTLHPNHTWEKVVFDPWHQTTWDVNDTIHTQFRFDPTNGTLPDEDFSPEDDVDVGHFFRAMAAEGYRPTWYKLRINDVLRDDKWPLTNAGGQPHPINVYRNPAELRAAQLAAQHTGTPTTAHLDTLGRPFLTVADNGRNDIGNDVYLKTRVKLDIEGNDQSITDPRIIIAFRHKFDIAGRKLYVNSVDAGEKWLFLSVDNQPFYSWDANGVRIQLVFDKLRRPKKTLVQHPAPNNGKIVSQVTIYGEELATNAAPNTPNQYNLRGQIYAVVDSSGLSVNLNYDFKGNVTTAKKLLAKEYTDVPDWGAIDFTQTVPQVEQALLPLLEDEVFYSFSRYDALNRVIESSAPDHSKVTTAAAVPTNCSVHKMVFNEANLLDSIAVDIRAERAAGVLRGQSYRSFVNNINYNARGQRVSIEYGNGVVTNYDYDPETYRLLNLTTRRQNKSLLQNLIYVYDPAGNIAGIKDGAVKTIYHDQQAIEPVSQYQYDPSYRLITVTGREHKAMGAGHYRNPNAFKQSEYLKLPPTNDTQALQMYTEVYAYDPSGNFTEIKHHRGPTPSGTVLWTRTQSYDGNSNRIATSGADATDLTRRDPVAAYTHDANGNFEKLPHLKNGGQANAQNLQWDYRNQLIKADLDLNNNVAYYQYDAAGQRSRKVVIKGGIREERIYFGSYELYRKYNGAAAPTFERQTLHIMDDKQRIALVEHRTIGNENGIPATRFRYQLSNHLGSSVTEVDESVLAIIISYEEYYPYGGTAYIGGEKDKANEKIASSKRYRYGKERDDETGLYYYGARYYAAWLGRWVGCERRPLVDGLCLYRYVRNNPIRLIDKDGNSPTASDIAGAWQEMGFSVGPAGILPFTGEDISEGVRNLSDMASEVVTDILPRGDDIVSTILRTDALIVLTAVQTVVDVGGGMLAGAVDPGSVVRGVMRMGETTAGGVENIQKGNVLLGGSQIVGEAMQAIGLVGGGVGLARTAGVPGTTSRPRGTVREPSDNLRSKKTERFVKDPYKPKAKPNVNVHGNNLDSTKIHHVYEIYDAKNPGKPYYKVGISGQELNKSGSSPRANIQVSELNKANPVQPGQSPRFSAEVVAKDLPNRRAALAFEQHTVNTQNNTLGSPPSGNQKPLPNNNYGPGAR